ncbi:MAG: hypothetical protein H0T83_00750, partial [Chthoniobacterales bacterium]|nr:hypothetical protein [Chthoniobacterales bacterium]
MKTKSTTFASLIISAIVLSLSTAVATAASFNILHSFNGSDGNEPEWLLTAKDGTLWGVTFIGGDGTVGNGVLYKIDGNGVFTIIHKFAGSPDGALPGRLIQAADGTIYGLTSSGGSLSAGTVYHIDLAGNYSVIHSFNTSTEGSGPNFLLEGSTGFFYGTTSTNGIPDPDCPNNKAHGTFFRMDAAGNVTPLHTFCESIDGSIPNSVVEASDGFFYGTCKQDGPFGLGFGLGTFWKSDAVGNVALLHVFGPKTLNGAEPTEPNGIVQAVDGLFYGVANGGGLDSEGAIFRADASG